MLHWTVSSRSCVLGDPGASTASLYFDGEVPDGVDGELIMMVDVRYLTFALRGGE